MSKKELTAEETVKKYGNALVGVGILYLILMAFGIFLQMGLLLLNPVSLIINIAVIALLVLMTIGVAKRKNFGVIASWAFEAYLLLLLVLSFLGLASFGIIELIIVIWLPFDIMPFAKALKEI